MSFHGAEMSPHVWLIAVSTAVVWTTVCNFGVSAGVKLVQTVQNHTDDYLDYFWDHSAADFRIRVLTEREKE